MTQLYTYTSDPQSDLLLAQLWSRMHADGDLAALFSDAAFPLSHLFAASLAPNELVFACDDQGIWFATWFNRIMQGSFVSGYIRPDRRGDFAATLTFKRVLVLGMQHYGTLLGLTRHKHLLPLHYSFGYTLVGLVPGIFPGGEDGYLLSRTPTEKEKARWLGSQVCSAKLAPKPPLPAPLALNPLH